jgi:V8-like Glu-specific endopeptidase
MRSVALVILAVGACGGGQSTRPVPATTSDTPSTTTADTPQPAPPAKLDPKAQAELDARTAFRNPGGMWLPRQLSLETHVDALQAMGTKLDLKALTDPLTEPLAAVVSLGFCTGSFVSPDGLVITNHHCAQGALEVNSTKESNLVENGFLAKTRAEEKSAGPAQHIWIAQGFRDVTHDVLDGLEKIADPTKRYAELEGRHKSLVAACEKDRPGIKCSVSNIYHGAEYTLTEYLELRDLRIVYVPHRAIGNYGGEIDNWAWPRHTGDYSFWRAYVGKDGKPADFSPDNVPYHPKHFLKIARTPLGEHDFVMVAGYPGSTSRLDTYEETKWDIEVGYPSALERFKAFYDLAAELMKSGGNTAIKAGVMKQGLQNGLENTQGTLDGLTKGDALTAKKAAADQLAAFLATPGHDKARAAIAKLAAMRAIKRKTAIAESIRRRAESGAALLDVAHTLVRAAEERPKPDAKRELGFQDRDMPDLVAEQKAFAAEYDPALDRAVFRLHLARAAALPAAQRPWLATILGGKAVDAKAIDARLDRLYASKLGDEALRLKLLQTGTRADLVALHDPFVDLALKLAPDRRKREAADKREAAEIALLAPHLGAAMRDSAAGALAPDANSSLRITYGTVRRFEDPKYPGAAFTAAPEILKKDTGKEPFDSPPALLANIKKANWGTWADPTLHAVPVCFISDLDTTGGNSGSPTLNAKGELVGLLFDGNIESVSSDVIWNGALTRSIHVDIRYAMWVLTTVDHADALATELGLGK